MIRDARFGMRDLKLGTGNSLHYPTRKLQVPRIESINAAWG